MNGVDVDLYVIGRGDFTITYEYQHGKLLCIRWEKPYQGLEDLNDQLETAGYSFPFIVEKDSILRIFAQHDATNHFIHGSIFPFDPLRNRPPQIQLRHSVIINSYRPLMRRERAFR